MWLQFIHFIEFIDFELVGESLTMIGEVIVAVMVIGVHHRVKMKHKIDKSVSDLMTMEQTLGLLGVSLIVLGYLIENWFV